MKKRVMYKGSVESIMGAISVEIGPISGDKHRIFTRYAGGAWVPSPHVAPRLCGIITFQPERHGNISLEVVLRPSL